jgi:hypothetical protein
MTTLKKILLLSGLAIAGISFWGYQKVKKLQAIFDKMTIAPVGFSNVNVSLERIKFNIDVQISNPTDDDFDVSGSHFANLNKLQIFYKGKYIATAETKITSVSVPHKNSIIFHDIPVMVSTKTALNNLVNFLNFDTNDISVKGIVSILGNEYTLEQ